MKILKHKKAIQKHLQTVGNLVTIRYAGQVYEYKVYNISPGINSDHDCWIVLTSEPYSHGSQRYITNFNEDDIRVLGTDHLGLDVEGTIKYKYITIK